MEWRDVKQRVFHNCPLAATIKTLAYLSPQSIVNMLQVSNTAVRVALPGDVLPHNSPKGCDRVEVVWRDILLSQTPLPPLEAPPW